jgi:hypothetical protein
LYTKFKYGNQQKRKESVANEYGIGNQSIRVKGSSFNEYDDMGIKDRISKVELKTGFMRHSINVMTSSSKKTGQVKGKGIGNGSQTKRDVEMGDVSRKIEFRNVHGDDNAKSNTDVSKGTDKKEVVLHIEPKKLEKVEIKSIQNESNKMLQLSRNNQKNNKQMAKTSTSNMMSDSKEIIISNAKPFYPDPYKPIVNTHSSLQLNPITQKIPIHSKINNSSNITPKQILSQSKSPVKSLKNSVHSYKSGYSNENGSVKSRVKQRVIVPNKAPSNHQPSHFKIDSAQFNSPQMTFSSGQKTEKISIYSDNKIQKQMYSVRDKNPKNVTYVRTYTNAQMFGNRITRRDPQFDSDNTFDNFESNNLTCEIYFILLTCSKQQ